jgi:hypothetical protein
MPETTIVESRSADRTPLLIALLATAALAVSNVETLHDAWCKYVGVFCTFKIESYSVSASSGGSAGPYSKDAQCQEHSVPVTIRPTTRYRVLDEGSIRFDPSGSAGRYDNGMAPGDPSLPKGPASAEVGWYQTKSSPREINALIFSQTGACEALRSISGKI